MTIAELIKKLSVFDSESDVAIHVDDGTIVSAYEVYGRIEDRLVGTEVKPELLATIRCFCF